MSYKRAESISQCDTLPEYMLLYYNMRTYDAATYSDLSLNAIVYMIQPALISGEVVGGNSSPFQIFLDGKSYSARIDEDGDGRIHVMVNGDEHRR